MKHGDVSLCQPLRRGNWAPWDTLGYPAIKGSVRRSPMKELDLGEGVDLRKPNFVEIKTNINHQTWGVNLVEPV